MTIIAGTGHRPNKLEGMGHFEVKRFASMYLSVKLPQRPQGIISGMAVGWDLALAHAALDFGIPVMAAIPFDGHDEFWPQVFRDILRSLLARVSKTVVVCDRRNWELTPAYKYQKRNEWMVDNADTVLALWNGDPKGGTANTVRYADKVHKPVVNCWDEFEGWVHSEREDPVP